MFNVWPFLDLQNWQFPLVMINMYKNDTVHACAKKQWGPQCSPGLVQFYSQECLALPHNLFQISLKYRYFILYFRCKSAVRLNSNLSTGHRRSLVHSMGVHVLALPGLLLSGAAQAAVVRVAFDIALSPPWGLLSLSTAPCFRLSPR